MERILVVDDDRDIVRLVRSYLEKAGYQVLTAFDGESALQVLRAEKPQLLILDLMLPDRDGWDVARLVRGEPQLAATPIIMLTARVEDNDKIVGLEIGADDYITKPFNPREVVARVRALLRRSQHQLDIQTPLRLQVGQLILDVGKRELTNKGDLISLTPSEFELLKVLMQNPGFVITRDELADKALGYGSSNAGRTLDSHIKNLRRKIDNPPEQISFIQTVHGIGYRLRDLPQ
ncbi:MAG: response regulator transcription factor [Anaerolineales bacterium]|nr:response regulator transcription factor [Anaerolineales bacterium]